MARFFAIWGAHILAPFCSISILPKTHIEVYDENGAFLFSADNKQEALEELAAA